MIPLNHQNLPLVIIGGGIHGVSIAMRILRDLPEAAKHLVILDRHPQPLSAWRRKTEGQGMTFLRSPAVHHIGTDPLGIVEYARSRDRMDELAPPYSQPSTDLFLDYCHQEIEQQGIRRLYHPFDVAKLRWDRGSGRYPFRIISQHNEGFRAGCVILAIGSEDCRYIPPEFAPWLRRFPERIRHACDFNLLEYNVGVRSPSIDSSVAIIGGGLTAGTLAKNLVERGAKVVLITRQPLKVQQFDFDPIWVGPKALNEFRSEPDWEKRHKIIQQIRGEGSMTPEIADTLMKYAGESGGNFRLYEETEIRHVSQPDRFYLETTGGVIDNIEQLILATGYRFSLRRYPFLAEMLQRRKIPALHGLPLLDETLQLLPIENLFASGVMAQLQIGPAAGNIVGAALAYERFRDKVLGVIPTSYRSEGM